MPSKVIDNNYSRIIARFENTNNVFEAKNSASANARNLNMNETSRSTYVLMSPIKLKPKIKF